MNNENEIRIPNSNNAFLAEVALDDDGEIMAVRHKEYDVYGLQFHPESILTPDGLTIIKNFCEGI